ncbi:MAG: C45 family peptidase [Verrucomicrobiota bacterium]
MKKWAKRIALGILLLFAAGAVWYWWMGRVAVATPPPLPADLAILKLQPVTRDGKTWLGKSWMERREGLLTVCLKGSPFEMGYAKGVLLEAQMHTLENEFLDMIHGYVPQDWKVNVLQRYIFYRNRHLSDFVSVDYRTEILGTTLACPDIHPELGNYYNRLLNYHAAHDVSYMMIDNPLIARAGCTAFGVWSNATANGHLLTGRNFDWEAAEVFSRDRVVMMFEPDQGVPFISLAWAGMAGVISGMNRAGISVTINGAPSSLPGETAEPVAVVARDVLQQTHNLAEALKVIRDAKVFVSTLWLVGSRADGKFVVVEKTPSRTEVRESADAVIICPNHFETPGLKDAALNTNYMTEATSVARESRLTELLQQGRGTIGASEAAKYLRDRRLTGGAFPGNGHRGTLNALIATHATVMDLSAGIFWAASPPRQLGKFVAFDVNDFAHELPSESVPEDEMLASGEYAKAREAQQCLLNGQQLLKHGEAEAALAQAEKAETLNPGFYQNAALRGRILLALHRSEEAAQSFELALREAPAFLKEQQQLEALRQKARGK